MKPIFFENYVFLRKCSLGSCATFSENMVSVSALGFEKFASQVSKLAHVTKSAKKTSPYGHLAKLVPQKRNARESRFGHDRTAKNGLLC